MSRPSFTSIRYKQNFEQSVIQSFSMALSELIKQHDIPDAEEKISRILLKLVKVVAHKEVWDVFCECNNQPNFDSSTKEPRENKRPDFTCTYKDSKEDDPQKCTKLFIVECKRLGNLAINKKRVNELYITNGVLRFINKGHGYGEMTKVGAMIGYVQSSDFDDILLEVNSHGVTHLVTEILLKNDDWQVKNVSTLDHEFVRPQIEPSPFKLHHLWADLR